MTRSGHFWTIVPHLSRNLSARTSTCGIPWSCRARDERYGTVALNGELHATPRARELLVILHGLGGSSKSGYVRAAARTALSTGMACLRLNMRGADRNGEDFYHAGLWQDLDQVLSSSELLAYESIYLLGYSIGGHVCLCWAAHSNVRPTSVVALASVCAPLNLAVSATEFDKPRLLLYRRHILDGLKAMYRATAAKRSMPIPVEMSARIALIREWDENIVAPRHGFRNAEDYYSEASVAEHLRAISVPTLVVVADHDPMVLRSTLEPYLGNVSSSTTVMRVPRGGHVGFPTTTTLGQNAPLGLESQVLNWLRSNRLKCRGEIEDVAWRGRT